MEDGKYEVYPCKLIVSEIKGERIVYDLTEIGEPTLTASGSLKNVPLAPGVNATAGTPGLTRTAVSANPVTRNIPKSGQNGNRCHKAYFETVLQQYRQNVDWFKYYVNKFVGSDGKGKYIRFTVRIENNWTKQGVHAATVSDVAIYENENAEGVSFRAHKLRGSFRGFTDFILSHYIGKGKGGQQTNGNLAKMSVGRLYTGSAAEYEKPSLLKVGTGEGLQVYGWGLYVVIRPILRPFYNYRP